MRCRHCEVAWEWDWEYCPECQKNYGGAIYPEQQTDAELAEIERLIGVISDAFRGVQLEDGTTIHEAALEGAYWEEGKRIAAREKDTETQWTQVPDWKIEQMSSALSFFDPVGWRFYIPAYMIWTLKNWRTTETITADSVVWSFQPIMETIWQPRFSSLSPLQSQAVHQFLKFFCDYSGDEESRNAMPMYWHQFDSDAAK